MAELLLCFSKVLPCCRFPKSFINSVIKKLNHFWSRAEVVSGWCASKESEQIFPSPRIWDHTARLQSHWGGASQASLHWNLKLLMTKQTSKINSLGVSRLKVRKIWIQFKHLD